MTKKYTFILAGTISEPKLINLTPTSLHNFSLRNIFVVDRFDFQPLYMGVIRNLEKTKKVAQTPTQHTDGHRDLETELAQWAD